uniref:Chemokine interleukin-8-like domain-containing protein n=1 Tax=Paramormyrops kingsleyae TaxID=1676925 RepID=A0A3B3S670_9TELE
MNPPICGYPQTCNWLHAAEIHTVTVHLSISLSVPVHIFSVLHISPDGNGPEECCFTYFRGRLKKDIITGYAETSENCSTPAIM